MKIALIHPDLGIGGAERLVVDAALCLQNSGHHVTIFTSHHDRSHCFNETADGTLRVITLGNTIFPRNIYNKMSIICASLRQFHLTWALSRLGLDFDIIIVDQLSACIPFLRVAFPKARIIFYCHHPDMVLASHATLIKKLYRIPFDWYEKQTTLLSDKIVVNSRYTGTVFEDTFKVDLSPSVLYPAVDLKYAAPRDYASERQIERISVPFFLSINRFERKKNIELALEAYATLLHAHKDTRESLLIIAGGYDDRVLENEEYLKELREMCKKYRMGSMICLPDMNIEYDDSIRVLFIPSVSESRKQVLLQKARLLLYTPENEHFGIVPLEAMREGTPVLATATGGPLETIEDGVSGFLRKADDYVAWYHVMGHMLLEATPEELAKMSAAAKARSTRFSIDEMKKELDILVEETSKIERNPSTERALKLKIQLGVLTIVVLGVAGLALVYSVYLFLVWLWPYFYMTISW